MGIYRQANDMFGRRRLACSFCGKGAVDVAKLVAGPNVYICDECVAVASRIMKGDEPDQPTAHANRRGFLDRLRARLRALVEHGRVQRSACQQAAPGTTAMTLTRRSSRPANRFVDWRPRDAV